MEVESVRVLFGKERNNWFFNIDLLFYFFGMNCLIKLDKINNINKIIYVIVWKVLINMINNIYGKII